MGTLPETQLQGRQRNRLVAPVTTPKTPLNRSGAFLRRGPLECPVLRRTLRRQDYTTGQASVAHSLSHAGFRTAHAPGTAGTAGDAPSCGHHAGTRK